MGVPASGDAVLPVPRYLRFPTTPGNWPATSRPGGAKSDGSVGGGDSSAGRVVTFATATCAAQLSRDARGGSCSCVGLIGAMLVVFTPRNVRASGAAGAAGAGRPGESAGQHRRPAARHDLTTSEGAVLHARDLRPTVLALVPANCDCVAALKTLVNEADAAGMLPVELVSTASQAHQLATPRHVDADPRRRASATSRARSSTRIAPRGLSTLTVVPVHSDGVIAAIVPDSPPSTSVEHEIDHLAQPGFDQIAASTRASPSASP